ncbi:MAG: RidA family protein [Thermomicrobiales bacterium]
MRKLPTTFPSDSLASQLFSRGLRLTEMKELAFFTSHIGADPAWQANPSREPIQQTREVLAALREMLTGAGYTLDDVVWVEPTVTKAYDVAANFQGFLALWAETFKEVAVKPAAGTFRIVDAFPNPDLLVEIQMIAAR